MTDREKLIDLLSKIASNPEITCLKSEKSELRCADCEYSIGKYLCDITARKADYLLKNGVLALLIKPGDTVYAYCEYFGVLPYLVGNFHIGYMGKEKDYLHWEAAAYAAETDELLDDIDFDLEDIGKDIFFTREEAKKALAKRNCDIAQNIESCEDCGFCERNGATDG